MSTPKRTPEEWLTVVRVARPIKTIFSEGSSDARIVRAASGFPATVDFRSADEVDFEPATDPYIGSNKARVLSISSQFQALADGSDIKQIVSECCRCLVDADFNALAAGSHIIKSEGILVVTEHSNLLSAFVTYEWFRGCMTAAYAWDPASADWDLLKRALTLAFMCRFRNAEEDLSFAAPNLGGYFAKNITTVVFRDAAYVQAYLGLQGSPCAKFIAAANAQIAKQDYRSIINSNDLFSATHGLLRAYNKIGSNVLEEHVRNVLLATAPPLVTADKAVESLIDWAIA